MTIYLELQQLYVAFFNRPADAPGLAYWTQSRTNGISLESIAHSFTGSPEFQALYAHKSNAEIVDAIYHNLFGRAAEQAGLTFWSDQLDSGHLDKGSIVLEIASSAQSNDDAAAVAKTNAAQAFTAALITPEQHAGYAGDAAISVARDWLATVNGNGATLDVAMKALPATVTAAVNAGFDSIAAELQQLYVAFFNRPADAPGLAYWTQSRINGVSLESIAHSFTGSPEYQALYAHKSNAEIVDAIYHNLFGRAAEQAGLTYWSDKLDSGNLDKGSIVLAIAASAQSSDDAVVVAKTNAAQAFTAALITPEQHAGYAGDAAVSVARDWLATVNGSGATLDIAMKTLPSVVIAAVDAGLGRAPISGTVVDGYIAGATVFADANGNGRWDEGEAKGVTDSLGYFALGKGSGPLIAIGGTDISTGTPVRGTFSAPAGYHQLTPVSTLVQAIATEGHLGTAEAETLLKTKFGISPTIDLAHFDPIAVIAHQNSDQATLDSALKVQTIAAQINTVMSQVDAVLRGSGVATDSSANVGATSSALAKLVLQASTGVDLASTSVMSETLRGAAAEAGATTGQLSTIAALASNAGQVIANLNQAIVTAASDIKDHGKQILLELAKVQYAAEGVATILQQDAASNDLSHAAIASSSAAITVAVADAAYHIGDVDGDNNSDAIAPPDTTVSATIPTITSVSSTSSNGSYKAGDTVAIEVVFSQVVNVNTSGGTPTLLLETGSIDHAATYTSGSGTNTLTFTYVVQVGDTSSDLDYQSTTALALNSGTIKDAAGNAATLTLAAPAATGSLGANKNIVIDTTAPTTTISTMAFSADTGMSSSDFNTKTAAQTISGTTSANIASGETVEVSIDNGSTWTTATTSVGANTWSLAGVTLTGSDTLKVRVTDTAGNTGTTASQAYVLDTTAPTTTIATMAFSADTGTSSSDFNTKTAAQTISGTTSANIASGETVEVSIDNGSTWTTATTSVGANTWSLAGVTLTGSDTLKV